MATVTMETEGKGLEKNLAICGIQAEYIGGSEAPQMFRFDFETHGMPTTAQIKKAVERLRVHFGDYQYDETPNGKGFAIIRPFDKPNTVYLSNSANRAGEAMKEDPDGLQKAYICFGKDVHGEYIINNLDNCKSMLVAGTSGSGKSVFLNDVIVQLLLHSNAELLLIDPKKGAELGIYERDIHNRIVKVAKSAEEAISAIEWAYNVMDRRYSEMGANCLDTYKGNRLVVVIDELATLMLNYKDRIEKKLCDIAALGRAAGVHLIIATQNPCAQIVTSNIKYNMQTIVCLKTMNARHSMNVIDVGRGASLLGRGDAYIKFEDDSALIRVQTPFISKTDILQLCTH